MKSDVEYARNGPRSRAETHSGQIGLFPEVYLSRFPHLQGQVSGATQPNSSQYVSVHLFQPYKIVNQSEKRE